MADVRSLLRQQRAARRIEHTYAAYSDAGKLLCTLCREQIKAEGLWDSHLQGEGHRRRQQQVASKAAEAQVLQGNGGEATELTHKRKLGENGDDVDMDDAMRRKKSRPDISVAVNGPEKEAGGKDSDRSSGKDRNQTPPTLSRRPSSNTPAQGVEIKIPSRPATPAHRSSSSSSSTPGNGPASTANSAAATNTTILPSRQGSNLAASAASAANAQDGRPDDTAAAQVDETEWAAFEADIAAVSAPYDESGVISAPAMTAEEAAAATNGAEENGNISSRKMRADVEREDEREEATRALEDEFEEMQELEARVQRLRDKREALRKRSESHQGQDAASAVAVATAAKPPAAATVGKENLETAVGDDEEDDDDEDEDDDWDGFRFRTA